MQPLVRVRLAGMLGRKFQREYMLAVASVREAMRALAAQVPGFEEHLRTAKEKYNQGYAVFYDKINIGEAHLDSPCGTSVIKVVPMTLGSKEGSWLQIVLGIVLIVVGAVIDLWSAGAVGAATGGAIYQMGMALVVGGVVQLLTPRPKGRSAQDRPENQPGFNFNGPLNTQAQGNCVSVLLGKAIIGSAVLSAGIDTEDDGYIPTENGNGTDSFSYGSGARNTYRSEEQ